MYCNFCDNIITSYVDIYKAFDCNFCTENCRSTFIDSYEYMSNSTFKVKKVKKVKNKELNHSQKFKINHIPLLKRYLHNNSEPKVFSAITVDLPTKHSDIPTDNDVFYYMNSIYSSFGYKSTLELVKLLFSKTIQIMY